MSRLKENIRIKKIREDLGYTQEQFAEFLEMSLSGYKKLESGDVNLTVDKLYMLNKKFGLSADYILFDEKAESGDVWMEICKLPKVEKWYMLMRLYAYLSARTEREMLIRELMEKVDESVDSFLQYTDGE